MRLIDLTGLTEEGMWSYGPPLPDVEIRRMESPDQETNFSIRVGSLSGTYLETAAHRLPDRPPLDEIRLDRLVTRAAVIKLKPKRPLERIRKEELQAAGVVIRKGDAVLVSTGWDRMWNRSGFVEQSPHFEPAAMKWLLDRGATTIGADIPCYDDPRGSEDVVNELFRRGALILAPLVNLRKVTQRRVTLIALAPRIARTCAFLCRAVVIEK